MPGQSRQPFVLRPRGDLTMLARKGSDTHSPLSLSLALDHVILLCRAMAALPSAGNALVAARLYTDDPLDKTPSVVSRETCYVSEDRVQIESNKVRPVCSALVQRCKTDHYSIVEVYSVCQSRRPQRDHMRFERRAIHAAESAVSMDQSHGLRRRHSAARALPRLQVFQRRHREVGIRTFITSVHCQAEAGCNPDCSQDGRTG